MNFVDGLLNLYVNLDSGSLESVWMIDQGGGGLIYENLLNVWEGRGDAEQVREER